MTYKTKGKTLIKDFFDTHTDGWYSVENVIELSGNAVPQSTIYRQINELVQRGYLIRDYSDERKVYLFSKNQQECHNHFHLMCIRCGEFVHIEDKETERLIEQVGEKNGFSINKGKTVLYGICKKCEAKE